VLLREEAADHRARCQLLTLVCLQAAAKEAVQAWAEGGAQVQQPIADRLRKLKAARVARSARSKNGSIVMAEPADMSVQGDSVAARAQRYR